jgi:ribonuclease HII
MNYIVGVDEAGRGSLFGRIYACAVGVQESGNLTQDLESYNKDKKKSEQVVIRDSKTMSVRQRNKSREYLEKSGVLFGIGWCEASEIDEKGIVYCNILAMHRALDELVSKNPHITISKIRVDGILFKSYNEIPYELIVKGDSKHIEIATASILAKTYHDDYIQKLCIEDNELEKYGLLSNQGYGTAKHIRAIKEHKEHKLHRKTFIKNFQEQILKYL